MAQAVFDCDDLKKQIFSYCLPQYPIITKKMIDRRLAKYRKLHNWQRQQPVWYPHWQGSWWRTMKEIRALPDDWWKMIREMKEFKAKNRLSRTKLASLY